MPFGAVVAGTTVHLTLRVEDADARFLKGEVRTWVDDRGEELIPMTLGESNTLVASGTTVHLTLRVEDADARFLKGEVRTWVDDRGEELIPMTLGESNTLVASIDCSEPCILWYSFRVTCTDGSMLKVGARA